MRWTSILHNDNSLYHLKFLAYLGRNSTFELDKDRFPYLRVRNNPNF